MDIFSIICLLAVLGFNKGPVKWGIFAACNFTNAHAKHLDEIMHITL